ncbi:hypothetical protein H5410_026740 [Solanum commersonii]|uniref:Uncharacterized protein n=1 Tax=Solanum commersonii TaxID=4109 RepID=A0A9J5YZQ2_SOLCO|nr:hypothetical protein H5410_026740 [Solanum commersonii]
MTLDKKEWSYGSNFLTTYENYGNYRITYGISRRIKFCSIDNLYKTTFGTNRLSLVEASFD